GEPGDASLIVPAFAAAGLIDLAAQRLDDGTLYRRLGLATLLGADAVDRARETEGPLLVFGGVASWLAGHGLGAVILDWRDTVGRNAPGRAAAGHRLHAGGDALAVAALAGARQVPSAGRRARDRQDDDCAHPRGGPVEGRQLA